MRAKLLFLVWSCLLLSAPNTARATDVTSQVSFTNGLYTYSYEVSSVDMPSIEFLVMVNSIGGDFDIKPTSTTNPAGAQFNVYAGINFNNTLGATYWGWEVPLAPGVPVTGFSFTTPEAPAANPLPVTYAIFSPTYTGGPVNFPGFYVGSVVAPDFLIVPPTPPARPIPEPSTYVMLLGGLGLIGLIAYRREKHRG